MKMLNMGNRIIICLMGILLLVSCKGLIPENKLDFDITEKLASQSYVLLLNQGQVIYNYLPAGYNKIDGAMMAAATDEADHAIVGSNIEKFQNGTWNAISNPDDIWSNSYRAIRLIKLFLRNSLDYKTIILRDTMTLANLNEYHAQCDNIEWLRNEAHVMNAYNYFELIKRYGGVPLVDQIYDLNSDIELQRSSYDEVVEYIITEIDNALPKLQKDWASYNSASFGRIDKGMAMALKSRVLLYWSSPQNNPSNDLSRWQKAASAAKDLIDYGKYSMADYNTKFTGVTAHQNKEIIFCYMTGSNNTPEVYNYPVTTPKGTTGTCPSGNLVDSYENADGTPFNWNSLLSGKDPYANRDPRLQYSIVVNNSKWNGRIMECFTGGAEVTGTKTSTTGYYLKKFLTDGLNLELNQQAIHSWPLFRYAEVLLNYAEAMNEAYGPDVDQFGDGKTARWAINQVRGKVNMPPVVAINQITMREKIKHERRIELAFEDHRFWDVRRWGEQVATATLGIPINGVTITKKADGTFTYEIKTIENRIFSSKMMLYPIPQSEVLKSNNIKQNIGW
jgi:starch-binding outer membrane protein, SusD/RagB family